MVDTMLDVETLGTGPRAVVLSIGAVLFDRSGVKSDPPHFYACVTFGDQINKVRREVTQDTLLWWAGQHEDALHRAFAREREPVGKALARLAEFKRGNVWANGPSFDGTIMETLYRDARMEPPWRFWELRCVRTIVEAGSVPRDFVPAANHDPVDDCVRQVLMVNEARRRLGL